MSARVSQYECRRCGVPCGKWVKGWKHFNTWHGQKSCGLPPDPTPTKQSDAEIPAAGFGMSEF